LFCSGIEAAQPERNLKNDGRNAEFTFPAYYGVMRVLVAEDRPRMARLLERALKREGHTVTLAFDGEQAVAYGRSEDLDVILLDVALPLMDGFAVLRSLREEHYTTPTIMVTARDAMTDIVRGLDLGADDYLTKPFSLEVLLARIRAVSRRGATIQPDTLEFEDLKLNRHTYQMRRNERVMALTRTEFALMEKLVRNAGLIVTQEALVEAGWGLSADVSQSSLYVFVRALRQKIATPGEAQLLHTARGVGYILRR
jgi:DNA-binding response OmpR family regulator